MLSLALQPVNTPFEELKRRIDDAGVEHAGNYRHHQARDRHDELGCAPIGAEQPRCGVPGANRSRDGDTGYDQNDVQDEQAKQPPGQ